MPRIAIAILIVAVFLILALTTSARAEQRRPANSLLDGQAWTLIDIEGHAGARAAQLELKFEGGKARIAGLSCFELAGPVETSQDALDLRQLRLRYWATCKSERQALVDGLHQAFRQTDRYAIVGRELTLMSAASNVLARFVRDTRQLLGSQPWTMMEINGQPAIRYSPTKLTFRHSGAHADDSCQFWDLLIDLSEQDRTIRTVGRNMLMRHTSACPPALAAQASALADVLGRAERYEQAADELRLLSGSEVLARFASSLSAWPPSTLAVGDATHWTTVEIGGSAMAADDRPTLSIAVQQLVGRARSCAYSGNVRHGHGEIAFWNLAATGSCDDARVDELLTALAAAARYELVGDALVLSSADGAPLVRLTVASLSPELAGAWRLVELAGERPISVSMRLTLPDGRLSGTVACNILGGRVRLGGGMVAFPVNGPVMMTLLACPGWRGPHANLGILSRARRYEASGDQL